MSWKDVDVEQGIAIDPKGSVPHQIAAIKDNVLKYTVFLGKLTDTICKDVPESYIKTMQQPTPLDSAGKRTLDLLQGNFINTIRPHKPSEAFELNTLAKAMTYYIPYNAKGQPIGFTYKPTLGYLTQQMTCAEADLQWSIDPLLNVMHSMAMTTLKNQKKNILFDDISCRMAQIISESNLKNDFFDNIDCVYRKNNMNIVDSLYASKMPLEKWIEAYSERYSSVHEYQALHGENAQLPKDAVIPGTAVRDPVHCYNVLVKAETLLNGAPFPEHTASAFANYEKHKLVWKKMGIS